MFGLKKTLLENFLKSHFDKYIKDGNLSISEFDTDSRKCSGSVLLIGEESPIVFEISKYDIINNDDGSFIKVESAKANRLWLQYALDDFLVGKEIPIPAMVAAMI